MTTKKKPQTRHIDIPILNNSWSVRVVISPNVTEVVPLLEEYGHDSDGLQTWHGDQTFLGLTFIKRGKSPVIHLQEFPVTDAQIGTLAHEACHAIESIFDTIDQPLGNEVFAHSVGAVVREVLRSK